MRSAVVDSCVLYSAAVRDLFMVLVDLYQPKWTAEIHEEWMRNILKNRPDLTLTQLERTRDLMNAHGRDCLVTRYRKYIASVSLPDAGDRHIVAAAIASSTPTIVTFNLAHFPTQVLVPFGIEAVHPDDFALSLYDAAPEDFVALVRRHRTALRRPPKTAVEYLATLRDRGLPRLAEKLQTFAVNRGEV